MYTAKAFLLSFVVLVITKHVTAQPPGLPSFGQGFGGFHLPSIPGFGGQNSHQGFPQLPGIPGIGGLFPLITSTTSSSLNSTSSASSSTESADTSTAAADSSTAEPDSSAGGSRKRRSADNEEDEEAQLPSDLGEQAAPAQPEDASPEQHHDRFLDFHYHHRGRRAPALNA